MKTNPQTRLARLAGLLLLSMLVFALGAQAAQAAALAGTQGRGGVTLTPAASTQLQGLTAAAVAQHQGAVAFVPAAAAGTQGRGGVAVAAVTPAQPQGLTAAQRHHHFGPGRFQPTSNLLAAQPAPSAATSRSAWIAAGAAAAIFLVGFAAWALTRRRRQPGDRASEDYCAQHPDDAMCAAA